MHAGIGEASPWESLKGQVLLGSEAFVQKLAPQLQASETVVEIPKRQRRLHRPSLKRLLAGADTKASRNQAMVRAYLEHDYTLADIGREVELHYATISRIIKADEGIS